jgi:hypothetical protein
VSIGTAFLIGLAITCLGNVLIVLLLFAGKKAQDATTPPPSPLSLYLAEKESRVGRMHFRRTTRWHEEVR